MTKNTLQKLKRVYDENKNLLNNIATSFVVKAGSVLLSFFTTPIYMRYFSNQAVLGVWFTLVSVFNMFLQFDLGIGNGLRNKLTESITKRDDEKTKCYISSSYIIIGCFSIFLCTITLILLQFMPLNKVFNVSENIISQKTLKMGIAICILGLCGQCVFRLITSICYALQKAVVPSFLLFFSNLLLLLVAIFAPQDKNVEQSFIFLAIAHAVFTNLPLVIASLWIFHHNLAEANPKIAFFDFSTAKNLLSLGLTFFSLQITSLFLTNCNEFLITVFTNPQNAVLYQVYYKVFSLPSSLFFLILTPLWSAITKAKTEGKYYWLLSLHRLLCAIIFFSAVFICVLVPLFPYIVKLWLKDQAEQFEIMTSYSLWFVLWCNANMLFHGNCTFANGLEYLKAQKSFVPIGGLLNVLGSFVLLRITNSWLSVIQVNFIILLLIGIFQLVDIEKYLIKFSSKQIKN